MYFILLILQNLLPQTGVVHFVTKCSPHVALQNIWCLIPQAVSLRDLIDSVLSIMCLAIPVQWEFLPSQGRLLKEQVFLGLCNITPTFATVVTLHLLLCLFVFHLFPISTCTSFIRFLLLHLSNPGSLPQDH